jgi:hypothetical protein
MNTGYRQGFRDRSEWRFSVQEVRPPAPVTRGHQAVSPIGSGDERVRESAMIHKYLFLYGVIAVDAVG